MPGFCSNAFIKLSTLASVASASAVSGSGSASGSASGATSGSGAGSSSNESTYRDINFFVSGSINSRN